MDEAFARQRAPGRGLAALLLLTVATPAMAEVADTGDAWLLALSLEELVRLEVGVPAGSAGTPRPAPVEATLAAIRSGAVPRSRPVGSALTAKVGEARRQR